MFVFRKLGKNALFQIQPWPQILTVKTCSRFPREYLPFSVAGVVTLAFAWWSCLHNSDLWLNCSKQFCLGGFCLQGIRTWWYTWRFGWCWVLLV